MLTVLEGGSRVALHWLEDDPRLDLLPLRERLAEQTDEIRAVLAAQGRKLLQLDAELGWVYAPNVRSDRYASGPQGARGTRSYEASPPPGVLRIAAFGDSFVHGNEVNDDEVWSHRLEQIDPGIEVANFGVGGYGLDQALLLFARRRAAFTSHVVVLGFAEVDLARHVNRYRRFLATHELPLFKPRFRLGPPRADGHPALVLLPTPFPGSDGLARLLDEPWRVREAGVDDWFYQPLVWENPLFDAVALVRLPVGVVAPAWRRLASRDRLYRDGVFNADAEAFRLLVALVRQFAADAHAAGSHFLLVIFPGRDEEIWGAQRATYTPLLDALRGLAVLDLAPVLRASPGIDAANLRAPEGHYGVEAQAVVARAIQASITERGWRAAASRASEQAPARTSAATLRRPSG